MYPEAFLFPRLFPCTLDYAPLGAMPLAMMLKPWSGKGNTGGMGTFMEHISIRTRNPLLLTAMQQNYRYEDFNVQRNLHLYVHYVFYKQGIFVQCKNEPAPHKQTHSVIDEAWSRRNCSGQARSDF